MMFILQSISIDSVDTDRRLSYLCRYINYVARTQENVVLKDAAREGQFTRDPTLSRLNQNRFSAPLLHQGKVSGILYLENN